MLKLVFKLKLVLKLMLVLMFILKLVFKHFVWSNSRWVGPLLGCMTFVTSMVKLGSTSIEMPCLTAIFSSSLPTLLVFISQGCHLKAMSTHIFLMLKLFWRFSRAFGLPPSLSTQTHVTKIPYSLWVKSVKKWRRIFFVIIHWNESILLKSSAGKYIWHSSKTQFFYIEDTYVCKLNC